MIKIEVHDSASPVQPFYARIVASNGQVLFTSETYVRKADAQHAAQQVKTYAASASIVDLTKSAQSSSLYR